MLRHELSWPHFDIERDHCLLLKTDCVPGRRGCVLGSKAVFAVPAEEPLPHRELISGASIGSHGDQRRRLAGSKVRAESSRTFASSTTMPKPEPSGTAI